MAVRYGVIELIELGDYVILNLRMFRVSTLQNDACITNLFLVHPILQLIHGWPLSTSQATSSLCDFSATTSLILAREEVRTSKVGGCVIVGKIHLAVAT